MSKLKVGDIITCFNRDELEVTEKELVNAGYGFIASYDMITMTWKIKIIDIREAADEEENQILQIVACRDM